MSRKVTVLIPSAHRLMQSLRDIGYDLPTAVADLVDNSIAADATEVYIDYEFEGEDHWIRIADNGLGMGAEAIDEALRFGTKRDYGDMELGKFGLGLKTASLSQCQRLTVASRTAREGSRIAIRQWDLEHIQRTDAWELLRLTTRDCHREATAPLQKLSHGTVVFWQRLDRVLGYTVPAGRAAQSGFIRMCHELEEHLAMIFHRFLAGEAKRKLPLSIFLNGNRIEPWDPFAREEPSTQRTRSHRLYFEHEALKSSILVQPYILPHESQFRTSQAHKAAAGPKKWNAQQGFYIYRNDRMLQSGGWNRIRSLDEHVKLARVAVDFPPSADAAFNINVAKMGINFPADVREQLTEITKDVTRRADEAYRRKEKSAMPKVAPPSAVRGNAATVGVRAALGGMLTSDAAGGGEARRSSTGTVGGTVPGTLGVGAASLPTVIGEGAPVTYDSVANRVVAILQAELKEDLPTLHRVLNALADLGDVFKNAATSKEHKSV